MYSVRLLGLFYRAKNTIHKLVHAVVLLWKRDIELIREGISYFILINTLKTQLYNDLPLTHYEQPLLHGPTLKLHENLQPVDVTKAVNMGVNLNSVNLT